MVFITLKPPTPWVPEGLTRLETDNVAVHTAFAMITSHSCTAAKLVERADENMVREFEDIQGTASVGRYGVFANTRLSWKRVYMLGATSVFYQNYGGYRFLGDKTVKLKVSGRKAGFARRIS